MKKDFFNNNISSFTHFMWKIDHISLKTKDTYANEFQTKMLEIHPSINKTDLYIINAIIFEERITKKSIANFLKKDPGNISRNIDSLIKSKIIKKEKVFLDKKNKLFLSVDKKFYDKYIVLANEFAERVFKIHFMQVMEEIKKSASDSAVEKICEALEELQYKHD